MAKQHFRMIAVAMIALLLAAVPSAGVSAQSAVDSDVTVTWPFDLGTEGQTPVLSPDGSSEWFSNNYVLTGSNLTYVGSQTIDGTTQTKLQPKVQTSGPADDNGIRFVVRPKTGLRFTPTKVSFTASRYGTDGGMIDIAWVNPDGSKITLETGTTPARNNRDPNHTDYSYDITGAEAAEGECGLLINIYSLGDTKQIGLANIVIEGRVEGSPMDVRQCSFAVNVSPEGAGTVSTVPVGTVFDENTDIVLSETRNFGYRFVSWTDDAGNVLSTDPEFTYTITDDVVVTANYDRLNTYSLTYGATGGGKDYMITPSPEPVVVDGRNMYEEGTEVTLTATGNYIMNFNSWSNGETAGEIKLMMNSDQNITADFSATLDCIAGWDFYLAGNNGRTADFAAADNEADALVLRNEAGDIQGWLDKSQEADGGYEGRPAAVNWRTTGLGQFYWQTSVNASAFTDIKVRSSMLLNYNAYSKYDVEYSLDGTEWSKVGTFVIPASKQWVDSTFSLPADADNKNVVYIRWKADTTSEIIGTQSDNDGIAISGIYITGTPNLIDDGVAPVLQSTVPAEGADNASANGRVVLTFDERVQIAEGTTATLAGQTLEPVVSGRTVLFEYKGLDYATAYTFTLPGNTVSDQFGNTLTEPVTINFTTRTRPVVTKALFDFIVPDDGTITEALEAAADRENTSERFRIFVRRGDYVIPASETSTVTGSDGQQYPNPATIVNTPNVSVIGEGIDLTSVVNTVPYAASGSSNPVEGLGKCETFRFERNATNMYLQDITLKNGLEDNTGRGAALEDNGDRNVFKNVRLYGYQDTYNSRNSGGRFYFEGGQMRGRTDYLCGSGDVYYNGVELMMCGTGGYLAVPSTPKQYGYIFKDCTIKGETEAVDGNYTLGRPWGDGTPIALYIDTRMEVLPSAAGWSEMSGGWPARFAEYNSVTAEGTVISLDNRKTTFGDGHVNNPVLTAEEAATMTIETVMGGTDGWDPTALTEQASAPANVTINGSLLEWESSDYVLCWAICKNGVVVDFTTENSYIVDDTSASYSVRAANEMGGLGEAVPASVSTGINEVGAEAAGKAVSTELYSVQGERVGKAYRGVVIEVSTMEDGSRVAKKSVRK